MKKTIIILVICVFMLTGCGSTGISQEEYDKVVAERDLYKEELDALKEQASLDTQDTKKEEASESILETAELVETDLNSQMSIKEYSYANSSGVAFYIMEITNNSPVTVSVEANVIARDGNGNPIGAHSSSEDAIESGYSVCLAHIFDGEEPESYDYTLSVKEDEKYKPVLSDLSYEASDTGKKVIIMCTNNGDEPANFVEGTVLFFDGDELVKYDRAYFTDDDRELKSQNTIAKEFKYYGDKDYDNFKVYFTGKRYLR